MDTIKQRYNRILNKVLFLYNFIVAKLIVIEDIQRRKAQRRKEYAEFEGLTLKLNIFITRLSYYLTPRKFSIKEQIDLIEALKVAVKFGNSVTQPFEFMANRKDLRIFVRMRCMQVVKELEYRPLNVCLADKGILGEEFITRIEVAYRTNNFISTYDLIINTLKDRRKRKTSFLIVLAQPILTLITAILVEGFVALSIVPDLIVSMPKGPKPPTIASYVAMNDIILNHKIEYITKFTIVAFLLLLFFRIPATRALLDLLMLQVPFIQKFIVRWEISKFFESLNAMILSGASLKEALDVSVKLVGNKVVRRSLLKDIDEISSKTSELGVILGDSVYVDVGVRNQLKLAGESGSTGETVLESVVEEYGDSMRIMLDTPMTFVIPIMLAFGGVYMFARLFPLYTEINSFMTNIM